MKKITIDLDKFLKTYYASNSRPILKELGDCEIESKLTKCTWSNYEGVDSDDTDAHWSTDCGKEFIINDGTPKDNDIEYCFFCGKHVDQLVKE